MDWLRYPRDSSHVGAQPAYTETNNRLFVINEGERQPVMSTPEPGQAITANEAVHSSPGSNTVRKFSGASRTTDSTKKTAGDGASIETLALPPKYARYNAGGAVPAHLDSEKAERLYLHHRIAKRGGWRRLLMLLVILACVVIALAVGLGVGLSERMKKKAASATTYSPASSSSTTTTLGFPVGEYSLVTALYSVQTNCTSDSATWRCSPYETYASSETDSLTTFNWILSNTSASYITNASLPTTDSSGIPANLTVWSPNPFGLYFTNQTLYYYNDNNQPRYEFNLTMSRPTVPSAAITSDDIASICYYNDTVLTGTMYLSDALTVDYPTFNTSSSYTDWPYAVQVSQVAAGGADVPACYTYTDGVVGTQIATNFTEEPASQECVCDYRNYQL